MDIRMLKEKLKLTSKTTTYLVIAAASVVLLIILGSFEGTQTDKKLETVDNMPYIDREYEEELTKELEAIISKIEGAGNVSVMLTMEGSTTIRYVQDIEKSGTETKADTVIIGNKEALLSKIDMPKVRGVLVVCSGGDSPQVREKIVNAVSTVLNISSSKVYVTNSNKER